MKQLSIININKHIGLWCIHLYMIQNMHPNLVSDYNFSHIWTSVILWQSVLYLIA